MPVPRKVPEAKVKPEMGKPISQIQWPPTFTGTTYIGVDPGVSGGLARIDPLGKVTAIKMPETERDVWEWFRLAGTSTTHAVIEQVGGFVGKDQPGSAMFKFGQGYGILRMALIAARIPFEQAMPQKWQKALGCPTRKKTDTRTVWKNKLKAHAQQIFPEMEVTLAIADALLIVEYCRRLREGKL